MTAVTQRAGLALVSWGILALSLLSLFGTVTSLQHSTSPTLASRPFQLWSGGSEKQKSRLPTDVGEADKLERQQRRILQAHQPDEQQQYWEAVAAAVLTWRSSLLVRTNKLYSYTSWQHYSSPPGANLTLARGDTINLPVVEPDQHERFGLFDAYVQCPPGQQLVNIHEYQFCGIETLKDPCIIYSMGSFVNQYYFEKVILANTPCMVYTFDCRIDGMVIHKRHRFYKLCVTTRARAAEENKQYEEDNSEPMFTTWEELLRRMGHTTVDLLKVDMEGFEYEMFGSWSNTLQKELLPRQISFELHYAHLYFESWLYRKNYPSPLRLWPLRQVTLGEMVLLFSHIADLGYAITARNDNPECPSCAKFALIHANMASDMRAGSL